MQVTKILQFFFIFMLLDPDPGSGLTKIIEFGSHWDLDPIGIWTQLGSGPNWDLDPIGIRT
jgi:hypothetical protein